MSSLPPPDEKLVFPPTPPPAPPFPAPPFPAPPRATSTATSFTAVTGRRVGAACIDMALLGTVLFALSEKHTTNQGTRVELSGLHFVIALAAVFAYYFISEALTSTTPGKRVMGLVVIDDDGPDASNAGAKAAAARTALRAIDGLPVLYLVGFIATMASPSRQRLGDMVAKTSVVALADLDAVTADRSPSAAIRRRPNALVLAAIAAMTLALGIVGIAARDGSANSVDRLGSFMYESDIVPFVGSVMHESFEAKSSTELMAHMAPGSTTADELADALTKVNDAFGTWHGDYTVTHREMHYDNVAEAISPTSFDVMTVEVSTTFDKGRTRVLLDITELDGQLRLLSWNVSSRA